jgi:hypothetical protein
MLCSLVFNFCDPNQVILIVNFEHLICVNVPLKPLFESSQHKSQSCSELERKAKCFVKTVSVKCDGRGAQILGAKLPG